MLITRTGWSGELGWEFYTDEDTDARAIWNHILEAGREFGLEGAGMGGLQARRIEAGIFNNLIDIDSEINPFQAGLGKFVHMDKDDFIGKTALATADREQLLWGLSCETCVPERYAPVLCDAGESGCFSRYLDFSSIELPSRNGFAIASYQPTIAERYWERSDNGTMDGGHTQRVEGQHNDRRDD